MHMSDAPQGGEEPAKVAEGEVTETGGSQVEQRGSHDLTAGGSDAGWGDSEGKHAEKQEDEPAGEAKKVRKSLGKAGKAAKGKLQKKKKKKKKKKKVEVKEKAKKKDKEVARKGAKKEAAKEAKRVTAKESKTMGKRKRGESSRTDDPPLTDSEEELYNDDNLFMPRALKKKAQKKGNQKGNQKGKANDQKSKSATSQSSKKKHEKGEKGVKKEKRRKKKNKMKSKFCTAECLPLSHYAEALEKELASYATSGFKKYLKFLKNYKTTVGVEDKVVSKKPRHMYV
ncbi:conserved Plasmodium protein, unknown function [Plasmodium vivax]|uniref:Uncharacterized protein n=1 Tax=Plasmodium vivax TaxID=5855 RepID=A0A564ZN73_PLAVI|nr:conserved Plasmodium protein, unknown function [Plasmodium vivax]